MKKRFAILLALSLPSCTTASTMEQGAGVVTPVDRIRHDHRRLDQVLLRIDDDLRAIAFGPRDDAQRRMTEVRATVQSNVARHGRWETRVLYPAIEKTVGPVVVESMRREHGRIVHESNALELEKEPREFARRAWMLLGLFYAHLDVEGAVILPLVERQTSAEDLAQDLEPAQ